MVDVSRWMSEDPIHFTAGDPNLYRYVGNLPTGATDPSGMVLVAWDGHTRDQYETWLRDTLGISSLQVSPFLKCSPF
jgi:uncharacterized protein RhaS with RHS repeats